MSSRYKRLSRAEAHDIMESDIRSKDFWAADYVDNSETLQEVLDLLYNSETGNNYTVKYQENQNGTRLSIHCKVCNKDLTSYDPFITHENGRPHKKMRQQALTPQDPNLQGHLQLRKHNERKGIFPEGSLEDEIDHSHERVLGVQFVYKEVIDKQELFTCQLCQRDSSVTRIRSHKMLSHLTSKSHNRKYLEVKFGFMKSALADFDGELQDIEETEGKIHHMIVDFTKQIPVDITIKDENKSESRARSPRSPSRSRSLQHSRRSRSKSPLSRRSRASSRDSSLDSSSDSSRSSSSPPPSEKRKYVQSPLKPPTPPRPPSPPIPPLPKEVKPVLVDVGTTIDMSDMPRHILKEVKVLQQNESRETLLQNTDMQGLVIQALWVLNLKLDKYYKQTKDVYIDPKHNEEISLRTCTNKLQANIAKLQLVSDESEEL